MLLASRSQENFDLIKCKIDQYFWVIQLYSCSIKSIGVKPELANYSGKQLAKVFAKCIIAR